MTTTTLPMNDPKTVTYEDVAPLIRMLCLKAINRHGNWLGNIDDCVSEAYFAFDRACRAWDPSRGSFITLLYASVSRYLINVNRRAQRKNQHVRTASCIASETEDIYRDFGSECQESGYIDTYDELSIRAQIVADLFVSAPDDLVVDALWRGGRPGDWKAAVKDRLRKRGWKARHIKAAFEEIEEVINA